MLCILSKKTRKRSALFYTMKKLSIFSKKIKKRVDKKKKSGIIVSLPQERRLRGSGGTGRRARLRGVWFTPYGFKSRFPHQ